MNASAHQGMSEMNAKREPWRYASRTSAWTSGDSELMPLSESMPADDAAATAAACAGESVPLMMRLRM